MKKLIGFILIAIILIVATIYYNLPLVTTYYTVKSPKLGTSFDQYKIVQLSDLHSQVFKKDRLLKRIQKEAPDLIVVTGDYFNALVGADTYEVELLEACLEIAPVCYVYGNHEVSALRDGREVAFFETLRQMGVKVLEDATWRIQGADGTALYVSGVIDPAYAGASRKNARDDEITQVFASLDALPIKEVDGFHLLLAHRPEYIEEYVTYGVDLVLAGHTHGGVIRIPFVGGVYALNQGIFPKYAEGRHRVEDTTLIVSRGLGLNSTGMRVFNPPELVVVTLKAAGK